MLEQTAIQMLINGKPVTVVVSMKITNPGQPRRPGDIIKVFIPAEGREATFVCSGVAADSNTYQRVW